MNKLFLIIYSTWEKLRFYLKKMNSQISKKRTDIS